MRKQGGSGDCRNALVGLDGGDSAFVSPIKVQPQKIMIACYAFRLGGRHAAWLPIFQQQGAAHTRHRRSRDKPGRGYTGGATAVRRTATPRARSHITTGTSAKR